MNTELKTLAERLGITEYPQVLEKAFDEWSIQRTTIAIKDTLEQLHKEFSPFGEYHSFLLCGAEEIQKDKLLLAWLSMGIFYCNGATEQESAAFPLPKNDGSLARDAFPALLLAMQFPESVKLYRSYGMDAEAIKKNLGNLRENIHVHEITNGRPALSAGLYAWVNHYVKARIFDYRGFNFNATKWNDEAILIKHRSREEYAFLMLRGSFTSEGTLAGIRGAEDVPAFFDATLDESDDAFVGYRASGQHVNPVRETFLKSEWEAVLRPGDDVVGFHIPRGADFSPAHVEQSVQEGMALARRYYPECNFKYLVCISWMLDPKLLDILPESSKIAHFIHQFLLRPSLDTAGIACMSFVWPGEPTDSIDTLPENTSLQRGIKKMMQVGQFTFWTTGVWKHNI